MNQTTEISTTEAPTAIVLYDDRNRADAFVDKLRQMVADSIPDLTTDKGRKEIASLAFKVAKAKTAIDKAGLELTAGFRDSTAKVNAERKRLMDALTEIQKEARAPLDAWEAAEEKRVADLKARMDAFHAITLSAEWSAEKINAVICEVQEINIDATWQEFEPIADALKTRLLESATTMHAAAVLREAQAAELAALRASAAARAEEDRVRREEDEANARRILKEKEDAERAEREREAAQKAEAVRLASLEAEKLVAAQRATQEAEAKAEAERKAIEDRAIAERKAAADREAALQRQIEAQKAETERAAQAERNRIEAERLAEADARAKREADIAHRANIEKAIVASLRAYVGSGDDAVVIAAALMHGKIPHVKVQI